MTREQIKEQFPDATDEQITAILNINGTDLKDLKNKIPKKEDQDELLRKATAYDKLAEADLTDAEKVQNALNDATAAKADFDKKSNRLDAIQILTASGLTEEDYKDVIEGIICDDNEKTKLMATNLAGLIGKQKETAIQKTKEELMDKTQKPGGGGGGDEKTEDVKFAEEVSSSFASGNKESADAFKNY